MLSRTFVLNPAGAKQADDDAESPHARTIPMTSRLFDALERMSVICDGLVVRTDKAICVRNPCRAVWRETRGGSWR
jgi:hypothetical protein